MNEIIAAIVGAVVTTIIGLIAYIYKSRQGNRLIVKRVSETPQIKISEDIRKNLKITYDDRLVDNLVLNTLVIFNSSNEIMEPVAIKLEVSPAYVVLDYLEGEVDDPLGMTKLIRSGPEFEISRPFVNPRKKFNEEEIRLAIFSNINLNFSVEGGGRGWYTKFEDGTKGQGAPKWQENMGYMVAVVLGVVFASTSRSALSEVRAIDFFAKFMVAGVFSLAMFHASIEIIRAILKIFTK